MKTTSLASRALRLAVLRIGLVAALAGLISYEVNRRALETSIRDQLLLSTRERAVRESLPFQEIAQIHRNFLADFQNSAANPALRPALLAEYPKLFVSRDKIGDKKGDGALISRPELSLGEIQPDGRDYRDTSLLADQARISLDDELKVRMVLLMRLVHSHGQAAAGRITNLYGNLPQLVTCQYWPGVDSNASVDLSPPASFRMEKELWFSYGFNQPSAGSAITPIYLDTTGEWMASLITRVAPLPDGSQPVAVGSDFYLKDLMTRCSQGALPGSNIVLFRNDASGSLIFHPDQLEQIKSSQGKLGVAEDPELKPFIGKARAEIQIGEDWDHLIAYGLIPDTDWVIAVRYPKVLMRPAIFQNLAIVVALGLLTLLVELVLLRDILQKQVAAPLAQLMDATTQLRDGESFDQSRLPLHLHDEVGALARGFATMADRIQTSLQSLHWNAEELRRRGDKLEIAMAEAQTAERAKTAFLNNMSHEIRTPLNAIGGYSQMLLHSPQISDDDKESLRSVATSSAELLTIFTDLIEYSSLEAQPPPLALAPVELHSYVDEILDAYQGQARRLGISLHLEGAKIFLLVDPGKIHKILSQLLSNGLKYSRSWVRINSDYHDGLLQIRVSDDGPGIAEDRLEQIFQAFKSQSCGTAPGGGLGLGLALAHRYADILGAKLTVSNSPGSGAVFVLDLPCDAAPHPAEPEPEPERPEAPLSPELKAELLHALKLGDIKGLSRIAAAIQTSHPAAAARIALALDTFDFDALKNYLNPE